MNYDVLKKLAEDCTEDLPPEDDPLYWYPNTGLEEARARFSEAANPPRILEMIALIETIEQDRACVRGHVKNLGKEIAKLNRSRKTLFRENAELRGKLEAAEDIERELRKSLELTELRARVNAEDANDAERRAEAAEMNARRYEWVCENVEPYRVVGGHSFISDQHPKTTMDELIDALLAQGGGE